MKNTVHLLEILRNQNDNGVARKIDYSKVLVIKNNLQTQIDNLVQLSLQQSGLLKYLIGIDLASKIKLSDSLSFSQVSNTSEIPDFKNQSEIKLLNNQIEISSLNKNAVQRSYLPTLSGIGQFYYQVQENDLHFFKGSSDKFFKVGLVGISLSVPIFDGFEKHSKIMQYEVELLQLQNTLKNTQISYSKDYSDALQQYTNSYNALLRQQENIKIAEEDYNLSFQGYSQQVVSLSDLMLSENSLTEARLSHVNALLQLKNAELDIKKLKGELLNY
jgi:outer membrane protein